MCTAGCKPCWGDWSRWWCVLNDISVRGFSGGDRFFFVSDLGAISLLDTAFSVAGVCKDPDFWAGKPVGAGIFGIVCSSCCFCADHAAVELACAWS
ncbi:MAG: hypothetical protein HC907_35025 [Richelia sp. SM1_7_0]|nr:hypothetical protein [Richelia sp. SM1_7_0]